MGEQFDIVLNGVRLLVTLSLGPFFVGYFYWAWRMMQGRNEGVALFDHRFAHNPFNVAFRPSLLTADGLRARRRFLICCAGMPLAILTLVAIDRWLPANPRLQRTALRATSEPPSR